MAFKEPNYYEIFEVEPNVSPKQLREAYLKAKSLFDRENLAVYSMYSDEERKSILAQIEHAYAILSDPEKKSIYDHQQNIKTLKDPQPVQHQIKSRSKTSPQAVGTDQTRPQPHLASKTTHSHDKLSAGTHLNTKTNLNSTLSISVSPPTPSPLTTLATHTKTDSTAPSHSNPQSPQITPSTHPKKPSASVHFQAHDSQTHVSNQNWNGALLQGVRIQMGLSLEELSQKTKLKETYIAAIEAEDFANLPAAVYVRGFVSQIAKALSLPSEVVTIAYRERYKQKLGKD